MKVNENINANRALHDIYEAIDMMHIVKDYLTGAIKDADISNAKGKKIKYDLKTLLHEFDQSVALAQRVRDGLWHVTDEIEDDNR